jgi:Flp pilus assembly protein TadD
MRARTMVYLGLVTVPFLIGAGSPSQSTRPSTPEYEQAYNKGVQAQNRKDYPEAVRWYRKAVELKADYPDALNNLGFSLRSIGKGYLDQAAQAYQKALTLNANHEQALEYQGELYLLEGQLTKASENVKRLEQLHSRDLGELKPKLDAILAEAKKLL